MSKTLKTLLGTVLCLCLMLGVMLCMGVSASAEETPEVYYGTADNLAYSGTLAEAVDAAEADSAITCVKLNKDITLTEFISIYSGTFTVDLNGYTITMSTTDRISISGSADVTFTDSSTAKTGAIKRTDGQGYDLFDISNGSLTIAGGSYSSDISVHRLVYIGGGTVTVQDGASFSSNNTGNGSIYVYSGELIIEGGSFSGFSTDVSVCSKATIKGGSFASTWVNIYYMGGTLDLSAMGSKANGLTLKANNTYSTEKITLPANMAIVNDSNQVVTTVDRSVNGFTVKAAFEVSFDANGGTGTMDAVNALGEYTLPACGFTAPTGKAFNGWIDSADGEIIGYPGDSVALTEDVTLYALWETDSVYVGGVELESGMYLAVDSTEPTATKPEGGYAYYEGGVLTLNNYTYEGYGFEDDGCAVYTYRDVTVELVGENSLTLTDELGTGIFADNYITLQGTGSLDIVADYGIYSYSSIIINSGTYNITAKQMFEDSEVDYWCGIYADYDIYINGGTINIESDHTGIYCGDDLYIDGGTINIIAGYAGVDCGDELYISGGYVNATGSEYGICSYYYINISGGYIKAEGYYYGIYAYDQLNIYGVGTEVIANCDEENGYNAIYSVYGYLYINDDVKILIPEDGYASDYCIKDADGRWVSNVHLKHDGPHIYVGGVGMKDGDYLDEDGNISDTKPTEGGYAYYTFSDATGGVLTLHDYDYYGDGYIEDWDGCCGIATELGNLTIVLEGYNTIDTDWGAYYGIWVDGNLTITSSGVLELNADYFGIGAYNLTIDGACVEVNASSYSLNYYVGDVTVKNGGLLYLYSSYGYEVCMENLILDRGSLIIENSYLFVRDYDRYSEEYAPGTIALNGSVLYTPDGGYINEDYDYDGYPCTTVFDAEGDWAYYITFYADGWINDGGAWYYYDAENDEWLDGLVRVPYPPTAIDGVTYEPNQDAMDYCEGKGTTFIDAEEGWFYFDEVFMSDYTGIDFDSGMYFENGFAVWHPGIVLDGEDYYYFTGDSENGGNKIATGDVYVSQNTTEREFVIGGMYTFDEDGILCEYDGITEMADGTLRYYEDAQLMLGKGLVKVGDEYIYVRSNGELAVDCEYYVSNNNGYDVPVGEYTFDENGYLVVSEESVKTGIYFENGAWYYYEDGKIGYNKGLIHVDTTWYGADGSETEYTGYIYVRSSGKLATGTYYITNVENDNSGLFIYGQRVVFSDIGIADMPKHGIVDVNGTLYFYQNNAIKYNAGLIEWNGGWIYVRSNGKVATGNYWITNTNGNLEQGMYEFGADGYMIVSDVEDGIVSADGKLYYYENGKKLYGVGLKQLDDGSYIYIRSNGQLAVGSYWITNHNDLLPEDVYIFGNDGILTVN